MVGDQPPGAVETASSTRLPSQTAKICSHPAPIAPHWARRGAVKPRSLKAHEQEDHGQPCRSGKAEAGPAPPRPAGGARTEGSGWTNGVVLKMPEWFPAARPPEKTCRDVPVPGTVPRRFPARGTAPLGPARSTGPTRRARRPRVHRGRDSTRPRRSAHVDQPRHHQVQERSTGAEQRPTKRVFREPSAAPSTTTGRGPGTGFRFSHQPPRTPGAGGDSSPTRGSQGARVRRRRDTPTMNCRRDSIRRVDGPEGAIQPRHGERCNQQVQVPLVDRFAGRACHRAARETKRAARAADGRFGGRSRLTWARPRLKWLRPRRLDWEEREAGAKEGADDRGTARQGRRPHFRGEAQSNRH